MTNHHFTGVFLITERRYRRLFSQQTNKNKKKKETGVRGMWRRTYAQLKNFSFNLLPVLFVFVWYTCPPFSGVQSGEMEPSYSWPRLLSPPNWLHVVYIIYFASPLEISTYCLPFCSSLTKSVCTIPVFV